MTELAQKTNLLGLTRPKMEEFVVSLGEKRFRAQQLMKWIHHHGVSDFTQMNNLSKAFRSSLAEHAEIIAPEIKFKDFSKDGTRKWVLSMGGRNAVEAVLIPEGKRGTLCVSSQVGCVLDCDFCSTGKQGFQRDLSVAEIISQIWIAQRSFGPLEPLKVNPVTNVVFMGMGEPMLNYEAVIDAATIMMDDFGYGLSKRRVTISTSGIIPAIDRLTEDLDLCLAVSLHATNNELRNKLVPVNKRYPIEQLIPACVRYIERYGQRKRATIEYVMLDGINDSPAEAHALVKLLKPLPSKVNLIPFNPFPHTPYQRSKEAAIAKFQNILIQGGLMTTVRRTRGEDIDAACGQLVGQVQDRTKRQEKWAERIELQSISP